MEPVIANVEENNKFDQVTAVNEENKQMNSNEDM